MTTRTFLRAVTASTIAVGSIILLPLAGSAKNATTEMVQVGTYESLLRPNFSGVARLDQVLTNETMGIGTFTNLDGELIMLGGVVYQVRPDGIPQIADRRASTPFLQAVRFEPEVNIEVPPGTACSNLPSVANAALGTVTGVVAVRVRGTFTELVTRSVTADPPPFRPLTETIAEQTVFPLESARAALVGFLQGGDAQGIGQPGLHLHALTHDRSAGGHVLSCLAGSDVQLSLQRVNTVDIRISQ